LHFNGFGHHRSRSTRPVPCERPYGTVDILAGVSNLSTVSRASSLGAALPGETCVLEQGAGECNEGAVGWAQRRPIRWPRSLRSRLGPGAEQRRPRARRPGLVAGGSYRARKPALPGNRTTAAVLGNQPTLILWGYLKAGPRILCFLLWQLWQVKAGPRVRVAGVLGGWVVVFTDFDLLL
jgi:hypothetical protein